MILDVVKNDLCTGCGTCVAFCPRDAISMIICEKTGIYLPKINCDKCIQCNVCSNVCPGQHVDFEELNKRVFGRSCDNELIGNYSRCFVGYSKDEDIRFRSASGGLITQILIHALEEGLISGALLTRMRKDSPLIPEPFIARTIEEIIESSGSKYCPVPANVALRELSAKGHDERETIAIVGLPCHIHGFRKAEIKNLISYNVIYFGIFCSQTPNFNATRWLLNKYGINTSDVTNIKYRGNGYPSGVKVTTRKGEEAFIPHNDAWNSEFGKYFYPQRCTLCYDGTAEFADISFGDAWLPEYRNDPMGMSIVVSRTRTGETILEKCKDQLALKEIDLGRVIESQKNMLDFKKRGYSARKKVLKMLDRGAPEYNRPEKRPPLIKYCGALSLYLSLWLAKEKHWFALKVYWLIVRCVSMARALINIIKNFFMSH